MRLLLWLSGEHPTLPRAEALTAFAAESRDSKLLKERHRLLLLESGLGADETQRVVTRLGLTHDASEFLFDASSDGEQLRSAASSVRLPTGIRFAVRAERLSETGPRRATVERDLGRILAAEREVGLRNPDVLVRCFIDGDYVWVGRQIWDRDPKDTAARHVKHRPVGSPVSLPPKTARALLNLAWVRREDIVYDPFCGTGGILLEGATMGLRMVGSDLDPEMVAASRKNLHHYGLHALDLFPCDIGDAPRELRQRSIPGAKAIVSDLPYGRSASSGKEPLPKLYDRAFAAIRECLPPGARAVVGVPNQSAAERAAEVLERVDLFKVWVHRSLTRHFVVLQRS